jgi:predicted  nucleic acid-binding Zn-ribbon protein
VVIRPVNTKLKKRGDIKMTAIAHKALTREKRLAEARRLSETINKKMDTAGITPQQVEKDVIKAYGKIKARRSSSSNRY